MKLLKQPFVSSLDFPVHGIAVVLLYLLLVKICYVPPPKSRQSELLSAKRLYNKRVHGTYTQNDDRSL